VDLVTSHVVREIIERGCESIERDLNAKRAREAGTAVTRVG